MVGLDLDAILRVPDIQQQDIKVEDGIRRDEVTCAGEITRVRIDDAMTDDEAIPTTN